MRTPRVWGFGDGELRDEKVSVLLETWVFVRPDGLRDGRGIGARAPRGGKPRATAFVSTVALSGGIIKKKMAGRRSFDRWSMGKKKWTRTWERRDWTRLRLLGLLSPSAAANPLVTEEVAIASFPKLDGSVVELSHDLPEREVRPVWTSLGARARSIE